VQHIAQCVEGSVNGGWWLVLKHVDHLGSHTMNVLAKAILKCMQAFRSKALRFTELKSGARVALSGSPGIFMMGFSRVDSSLPAGKILECQLDWYGLLN